MDEMERHTQMIRDRLADEGFTDGLTWSTDPENGDRAQARVGRAVVVVDDEDRGLFTDDTGELFASVVGAADYNNERVSFGLVVDGLDGAVEVTMDDVEVME